MQVTPSQDNRQTRLRRPQPQRTSSPKSPRLNRLDRPLAGLDTETTGIDYRHGCRPYYVSIYKLDPKTGEDDCWEWEWFVEGVLAELGRNGNRRHKLERSCLLYQ